MRLLTLALPGHAQKITLGDQTIFEAVLAALGLPRGWRMRLARAFGSADMLAAALADLASPPKNGALPEPVAALVADGDLEQLAAHISAGMAEAGLSPTSGRTPQEIARRLVEKAELRSVHLSAQAFSALETFLAIDVPLDRAAQALEGFAASAGLSLGAALRIFPPASKPSPGRACRRTRSATTPPSAARSIITLAWSSRFPPAMPPGRLPAAAATTGC